MSRRATYLHPNVQDPYVNLSPNSRGRCTLGDHASCLALNLDLLQVLISIKH